MRIKRGGIEGSLKDYVQNLFLRACLKSVLALPYETRVRFMGWFTARVIAPLSGWDKRVKKNLAHVMPDLPEAEVKHLMRAVPNNAGRTLIEIYSGQDFLDRIKEAPMVGPGVKALETARAEGRPIILVTAHFGNYDAPRGALTMKGYEIGALYRPMDNRFFNKHYVASISKIGTPVFAKGREGSRDMLRHIKKGGHLGVLFDLYVRKAPILRFMDQPAKTATSAADLALKFDAVLLPIYGRRLEDGLNFEILVEEPIAPADPADMLQSLNDQLETLVRENMEQWFWIHRRWKPERLPENARDIMESRRPQSLDQ